VERKLAGEQPLVPFSRTYLRPDGARMSVEIHDMYLRDEQGMISGIRSFLLDTTERDEAQKALRASEQRYRHLVEHASDIIYQADVNGRFVVFNRMATEILGYSAEELIGRKYLDLIRPDFRARTQRFYRQQLARRVPRTYFEFPVISKAGQEIWFGQNVELVQDGGRPEGFEAVTRDITRQRLAQEEQRHAREELERRVNERTAELQLANESLRREIQRREEVEGQRRAVEAQLQYAQRLESIGVLAGGIAHDFNNLLAAIMGHADLALLDSPDGSSARSHLQHVLQASRTAADLTQQMLAYSGRGRFVVEQVDVSRVIEDALRLVRTMISKKASLRVLLDPDLPSIRSDPSQIRQVIANLVTNASEALLEQPGEIKLRTRRVNITEGELPSLHPGQPLPAGSYLEIEVVDTGCGMDAATQAKIFDPFFTTKFHGRGLGLAAVLGIVRSHDGAIEVESALGCGSRFRVLLPCSGARSLEPLQREQSRNLEWHFEGVVLVVDDEPSVRSLSKSILERVGAQVLTASDGDEALAQFAEHGRDIRAVLLDLTMPGAEIANVFRELAKDRPDLKIIVCSGYTWQDVEAALKGNRPAAFVRKPFTAAELIDVFQSVCAA
jgi:PAS domain S-box-containing protein